MRFIKLELKNFKPYYDKPRNSQEILLFDEERKNKNITLNIGPTGHGKTSISEAILWCLFGDTYLQNWEELVNTLANEVAKQKEENLVNISVELTLEREGEHYRLIRSGSYDITIGQKTDESKLSVIHDGEPISDPEGFVANYFPTLSLMKYFVFDADDILKKFEENREGTIKDHINKIVGVEKLDYSITSLEKVKELYDEEISEIEKQIHGDKADKIKEKEKDKRGKREAIRKLNAEIQEMEKDKKKLFKVSPSRDVKKFVQLVNKRDNLEKEISELNKRFIEGDIISNIDLLLLDRVVDDTIKKLNQKQTTKEEFETSVTLIKSSLGDDYSGIYFDNTENIQLIKKGVTFTQDALGNLKKLNLESGEGIKTAAIKTFRHYEEQVNYLKLKVAFKKYKREFDKTLKELMKVRNEIKQLGDTTKNRELKERYEKFKKIEKQVEDKKKLQKEINEKIKEIENEIESLRDQLKKDKEQEQKIKQIEEKKQLAQRLLDLSKKTRSKFLENLLSYVNKIASEFLRNTVSDTIRFHSIEIDSNYQFRIVQKNGEPLEDSQINRGNLQISMMSFFFGLSKYLRKELPYIIDDPLLRLDPGHDKRLIKQVSKTNEQLIFHMIPGKEYTSDSFKWLHPHINTQNWIFREKYKNIEFISYVERKNTDKIVDFDIDKF